MLAPAHVTEGAKVFYGHAATGTTHPGLSSDLGHGQTSRFSMVTERLPTDAEHYSKRGFLEAGLEVQNPIWDLGVIRRLELTLVRGHLNRPCALHQTRRESMCREGRAEARCSGQD